MSLITSIGTSAQAMKQQSEELEKISQRVNMAFAQELENLEASGS